MSRASTKYNINSFKSQIWDNNNNRRALALQKSAQIIIAQHEGLLPDEPLVLQSLPGIGKATFNKPTVFSGFFIKFVPVKSLFYLSLQIRSFPADDQYILLDPDILKDIEQDYRE